MAHDALPRLPPLLAAPSPLKERAPVDGQAAAALLHPSTPLQAAQPQPASPNSPFAISPFASTDTGFFSSSEGLPLVAAPGAEASPAAAHAGWPAAAEEAPRPPRGAAALRRPPLAQRAKAVFTAMERLLEQGAASEEQLWGVARVLSGDEFVEVAMERAQAGRCGNPLCRAPTPSQTAQGPLCCSPTCEAAVRDLAHRLGPHSAAQQRYQLMLQHAKRRQRAAQQQDGQAGNSGSGGGVPEVGGEGLASMAAAAAAFGPRPPSPGQQLPVSAFAAAAQRAFSRGFSSALADAAPDPSLHYQHYLAAAPTVPARHVLHQPDAQHAQQAAALAASHQAAAQQLAQQAAAVTPAVLAGEPTVIAAQPLHPYHPLQQAGRGPAAAAAGGAGGQQRRVRFTTEAPNDSYWC